MSAYIARVKELVGKRSFLSVYVLVFIACFAYVSTHISIGVDDPIMEVYFSGASYGQGRFTGALIANLFGLTQPLPVIPELLYGALMLLACVGYLHLLEISLGYQLDTLKCLIFTTLFISYPLIAEIYAFNMMPIAIGTGYLLTALALIYGNDWTSTRHIKPLFLSILLMVFAISAFESFAVLFICGSVCSLLLKATAHNIDSKSLFVEFFRYILILSATIALEYAVTTGIIGISGIETNTYAANQIVWLQKDLLQSLYISLMSIGRIAVDAVRYLPIRIYLLSAALGTIISVIWWKRKKRAKIFLLYVSLVFSTWLLAFLQGSIVYRASQAFALFISFVGLSTLITIDRMNLKRLWMNAAVALCVLVLLWQSVDLNRWFMLDYRRSEEEKRVLLSVSDSLHEGYDLTKPIVFIGEYSLSEDIRKHLQFNANESKTIASIIRRLGIPSKTAERIDSGAGIGYPFVQRAVEPSIGWLVRSFQKELGVNGPLFKHYGYLGIDDLIQGDFEMYMDAHFKARDEAFWPENAYIADAGVYTIVDFSRYSLQNAK